MKKEEFIEILLTHADNAGVFGGRFNRTHKNADGSENNDFWSYRRPAVDCFEPSINLSVDGQVSYENYSGFDNVEPEIYSYEDFLKKYFILK
jgi:hypothetical protein